MDRQWFSSGWLFPQGTFGHYLKTLLVVRTGAYYQQLVGRSQGCCKTCYNTQYSPPTKNYPVQNVSNAKVKKLWARGRTAGWGTLWVPRSRGPAKGPIPMQSPGSEESLSSLVMGLQYACASRWSLLTGWSPDEDGPQQCVLSNVPGAQASCRRQQ